MKIQAIATSTNLYIMGIGPTLRHVRGGRAGPPLAYT
jgi:hypothetical protein